MGPLLHTISLEVPGSLGEPAVPDALLCVWEWQVCLGAQGRLSGLLSVSAWLLAPGGQRAALSASSRARFLFGKENRKKPPTPPPPPAGRKWSSSRSAFSLFCWPWLVRKGPRGWVAVWIPVAGSCPLPPLPLRAQEGTWASLP